MDSVASPNGQLVFYSEEHLHLTFLRTAAVMVPRLFASLVSAEGQEIARRNREATLHAWNTHRTIPGHSDELQDHIERWCGVWHLEAAPQAWNLKHDTRGDAKDWKRALDKHALRNCQSLASGWPGLVASHTLNEWAIAEAYGEPLPTTFTSWERPWIRPVVFPREWDYHRETKAEYIARFVAGIDMMEPEPYITIAAQHIEWAIRFQLCEKNHVDIARRQDVSRSTSTVTKGVNQTLALVGLRARPSKPGRERANKPHTVRVK